jgi:hypothetical protein
LTMASFSFYAIPPSFSSSPPPLPLPPPVSTSFLESLLNANNSFPHPELRFRSQTAWIPVVGLPLPSCVTSENDLTLLCPTSLCTRWG